MLNKKILLAIFTSFFLCTPVFAAPTTTYQRNLYPETTLAWELGTSTKAWAGLTVSKVCLTADNCRTTWPLSPASDWISGTTYNTLATTPSTSISIWDKQILFVSSSLYVDGLSQLSNVTVTNTLSVTGLSTLGGFISTASSSIGSSLNVSGNLNASSSLFVAGLSNLGGFISTASSSINGGLRITGALNASSTLFVAQLSTLSGGFNSAASSSVGGTFSITGATTVSSTLSISGLSTLTGFNSTASSSVGNTFSITGATTVSSTLSVSGLSTFTGFLSTASSSVGGGLRVSGAFNASSSIFYTGTLMGNQSLSNAQGLFFSDASGNTFASGTLRIFGLSTLSGVLSLASSTFTGGLSVTGALNASGTVQLSQNVFQWGIPPVFTAGADNDSNASTTVFGFNDVVALGRYTYYARNTEPGQTFCSPTTTAGCDVQIYDNSTTSPQFMGGFNTGVNVLAIKVAGQYAYIALAGTSATCTSATGANCELQVWNISDVSNPKYISGYEIGNTTINNISLWGHFLLVAHNLSATTCAATSPVGCEVDIIDVGNPYSLVFAGGQDLAGATNIAIAYGNTMYIGKALNNGFCSVTTTVGCEYVQSDLSNIATPSTTAVLDLGIIVNDLQVQGKYLYLAKGIDVSQACSAGSQAGCEFVAYDISSSTGPLYIGGTELTTQVKSLSVYGRYVAVGKTSDAATCTNLAPRGCEVVILDIFTSSTLNLNVYSTFQVIGGVSNGDVTINKLTVAGHYLYAGTAGNAGTCSPSSPIGCEAQTFDLGGVELATLIANALEAGSLQVRDNAYFDQNVYVRGGLTVGTGGEFIQGGSSIANWLNMASGTFNGWQGTNVPSANNLVVGTGNSFAVTGNVQINTISTSSRQLGSEITLIFSTTSTVKNNTVGTGASMFLAGGADFSATASDTLRLIYSQLNNIQGWFEEFRSAN